MPGDPGAAAERGHRREELPGVVSAVRRGARLFRHGDLQAPNAAAIPIGLHRKSFCARESANNDAHRYRQWLFHRSQGAAGVRRGGGPCSPKPFRDAAVTALRSAGATVVEEPVDQPWGERSAGVTDPDGNRMLVLSRLP
ncbi:VOC family protein [Micromonospora sp. NPDC005203]|uniref:VOC family protein n=1 Tax=Micromonospora sp. NPDC005203 TaxID=3364226 RepID=UPI0036BF3C78